MVEQKPCAEALRQKLKGSEKLKGVGGEKRDKGTKGHRTVLSRVGVATRANFGSQGSSSNFWRYF